MFLNIGIWLFRRQKPMTQPSQELSTIKGRKEAGVTKIQLNIIKIVCLCSRAVALQRINS